MRKRDIKTALRWPCLQKQRKTRWKKTRFRADLTNSSEKEKEVECLSKYLPFIYFSSQTSGLLANTFLQESRGTGKHLASKNQLINPLQVYSTKATGQQRSHTCQVTAQSFWQINDPLLNALYKSASLKKTTLTLSLWWASTNYKKGRPTRDTFSFLCPLNTSKVCLESKETSRRCMANLEMHVQATQHRDHSTMYINCHERTRHTTNQPQQKAVDSQIQVLATRAGGG